MKSTHFNLQKNFETVLLFLLKFIGRPLIYVTGIGGVLFIPFFLIYGIYNNEHLAIERKADGPKFAQAILAAKSCTSESLRNNLVYPLHSLVVYWIFPDVDWADSPGGPSERASKYHYACPEEWRATTKEEVRLVVLVSFGSSKQLGTWSHSGLPAYKDTWNVVFVDLPSQEIVAKAEAVHTPGMYEFGRYVKDKNQDTFGDSPFPESVVSMIRKTVKFEN